MDCLAEANKVSTLARRRENPKALFADAAVGIAGAPRGFLEAPSVMLSAARRPAGPERRASWSPGGSLPRAGMASLWRPSAASGGGPRAFGMRIPAAGRLAGSGRTSKPPAAPRPALAGQGRKPEIAAPAKNPGKAYRVSARVAFRQPAPGAAGRAFTLAERAGQPAAFAIPTAPRPARLFASAPVAATRRASSRLAYGEMGFTGSPDAPAQVKWVGLVLRKGLAREGRTS
jgi:hypothetical protein